MEVNRELPNLADGLDESVHLLAPGGRVLVLAYHSLEDRIVKERFPRGRGRGEPSSRGCPSSRSRRGLVRVLTRRADAPARRRGRRQPRARSARLRAAEKLAAPTGS